MTIASKTHIGLLILGLVFSTLATPVVAAERSTGALPRAEGWVTPENVSASPGVDSEAPALAVTDAGAVHLVWEEGEELHHSHRVGDTWSEPERIAGTGDGEQPALAMGPGNTVHLVYVNNFDIFYVSWDGSGWSVPQNVSKTDGTVSDSPDVAVGTDGSVHVVATETAAKRLYYGETDGSTPWTYVPIVHEFGFAVGEGSSIDVTGTNMIQLAFKDENQDIYAMRRSGGSWSPPESVSEPLAASSTAPALATDGNGVAHVVWQEEIDGMPQILYAHAEGEGWSPIVTLSKSTAGARLPDLAIDSHDRQHAVWHEGGVTATIQHASRSTSTGTWSASTVHTSSSSVSSAVIASGPGTVLHIAWVEDDPGDILYARRTPHRVFLPITLANVWE